MSEKPKLISTTAARQGVTGTKSRYVLLVGLTLAVIAGIIVFLTVGN